MREYNTDNFDILDSGIKVPIRINVTPCWQKYVAMYCVS